MVFQLQKWPKHPIVKSVALDGPKQYQVDARGG